MNREEEYSPREELMTKKCLYLTITDKCLIGERDNRECVNRGFPYGCPRLVDTVTIEFKFGDDERR